MEFGAEEVDALEVEESFGVDFDSLTNNCFSYSHYRMTSQKALALAVDIYSYNHILKALVLYYNVVVDKIGEMNDAFQAVEQLSSTYF